MNILSVLVVTLSLITSSYAVVSLTVDGLKVIIKNDFLELQFKENAQASKVYVNGTNILNTDGQYSFYLDWSSSGQHTFKPEIVHIVEQTSSRVHFYWIDNNRTDFFTIELHYIMEDGLSGIYSYAKYINDKDVNVNAGETRIVYRFNNNILTQGTNQARSGTIPNKTELSHATGVQDATYRLENGTYYTKYDYAVYIRETNYQGFYDNGYGAFVISPSREYHGGGAMKQDLTVHDYALVSNYFISGHFGTPGLHTSPGWRHIYGPFLLYFPTGDNGQIVKAVEEQVEIEKDRWPYSFVNDPEYPLERGSVSGVVSGQTKAAVVVYDSLNETYDAQQLGYLFTTETDSNGRFVINKVRPGTYRVVAYPLAGQGCEGLEETIINVTAGSDTQVNFTLSEPENIIWSLGEVNRRSSEFKYSDQPRNFQWESYPPLDNNFTIGVSDPAEDWYYAQSKPHSHWFIHYNDTYDKKSRTLRLALAASTQSHLIVTINGHRLGDWYHANDHAIYRSAMQSGMYHNHTATIRKELVKDGENTLEFYISLGQIMYDAISLQRN